MTTPEMPDFDQAWRQEHDVGPMRLLSRIAKLEGEIDADRRLIWLLVRRLGGKVTVTDAEVAAAPGWPDLTVTFDRLHDARTVEARL